MKGITMQRRRIELDQFARFFFFFSDMTDWLFV